MTARRPSSWRPRRPKPDEETKKKLQALEQARDIGIITDKEFERKKAALLAKGPVTAEAETTPAAKALDPIKAKRQGKTFEHPIGFKFWHPADWKVQEFQGGLRLIPANESTSPQGPNELYVIIGDQVVDPNINRVDHPLVIQYLDQKVRATVPFLAREGQPKVIQTPRGKGLVMNWKGTNQQGKTVNARAYAALIKNWGVALIGMGLEDLMEKREGEMKAMFETFGFGAAKVDPDLVGDWRCEKYYSSSDQKFSSNTIINMRLGRDGTFIRSGRTIASLKDGGTLATQPGAGERGTWAAANGRLFLYYADGSYATYQYHREGGSMLLQTSDGKKELWQR